MALSLAQTPALTLDQKGGGQPLHPQEAWEHERFGSHPAPGTDFTRSGPAVLAAKRLRAPGARAAAKQLQHPRSHRRRRPLPARPPGAKLQLWGSALPGSITRNGKAIEAASTDAIEAGRAPEPHVNTLLIFFFLQMVQFRKIVFKLCLAETEKCS